jgi:hypothetical protein
MAYYDFSEKSLSFLKLAGFYAKRFFWKTILDIYNEKDITWIY